MLPSRTFVPSFAPSRILTAALFCAGSLVGLPAQAPASGLTTHVTITEFAIEEHLPPGEVLDLLEDPELRPFVRNGTMFPDGGYAMGDPYSEIAHWEPFQNLYLQWIQDNYSAPWSLEAKQHIAFLLGMGSHGMSDQVFDGLYMERARQEDSASDWANTSMDTATDVALAAAIGGQVPPDGWVPPPFVELFAEAGHGVSAATLDLGQDLTAGALRFVQESAYDSEQVARFHANYPWASDHIVDETVPGAPPQLAPFVAEYWLDRWERLHREGGMRVLGSVPPDGSFEHPTDSSLVEARLAVVFSRSTDPERVAGSVTVADEDGTDHPVALRLFYGRNSHVLLVTPEESWAADSSYTVTVAEGTEAIDGSALGGAHTFVFSTGPTPTPPEGQVPPMDEDLDCEGCSASGRADGPWLGVLILPAALVRRRRAGRGLRG